MIRTVRKVECPSCHKMIACSMIDRHINSKECKRNQDPNKQTYSDLERIDGKVICPVCSKLFPPRGIASHMWRTHGKGKDFKPTQPGVGHSSWNKGIKKIGDEFISNPDYVIGVISKLDHTKDELRIRRLMRKHLLLFKGNICSICGTKEWMGKPVPLVCDHIDGYSNNGNYENFRLVCGNCDMQLPTYKGKNYGKGRSKLGSNQ